MLSNDMMNRLLNVLINLFKDENIDENTTAESFELWDSLKQIEIMIACEEEFGVHFSMAEIINATSVKALHRLIVEKRGNL